MLIELACMVLLVGVVSFGLGWPFAARLQIDGSEKLLATIVISLIAVWLAGWVVYAAGWSTATMWTLPALALAGIWAGRRALVALWRETDVRALVAAQTLVTTWCVGWLALVVSYSGGDWVGDWFGHWQRTLFFLERWPRDHLFAGFDPLASRPPLVNVVTGVFLRLSHVDFAGYQLAMSLLGSLAFLPAALLARRFGGRGTIPILALVTMLNPAFVQNATYAWTKLPAAFFVLAALHFFLRAGERPAPGSAASLAALALGAGILAHYSAVPYVIALAIGWLVLGWTRRHERGWQRVTAAAVLAGTAIVATWFAWAIATYGARGTFLANTSITDQAPNLADQLVRVGLNLRDTIVPHFLRGVDFSEFAQRSPWGAARDGAFLLWQTNLIFAVGCAGWLVIATGAVAGWRGANARTRMFWAGFVGVTVLLGIAAHALHSPWGVGHICLQPLVLFGLAFLAARWIVLPRVWRVVISAGMVVDFAFGIALQFGCESFLLDRWLAPARAPSDTLTSYSACALMNLRAKHQLHLDFFSDVLPAQPGLVLALLAAFLMLAIARLRAAPGALPPPAP